VRCSRVCFTISGAKVWRILIFGLDFLAANSNKIAEIGFGRKNRLNPQSPDFTNNFN
jgi:hypothetical protein